MAKRKRTQKGADAHTKPDQTDFHQSVNDMREALLGIAELEAGVLDRIRQQLDQMLGNIYTQMQQHQAVIAKDAMITEAPLTQPDEALASGLGHISEDLSAKNQEILKLQRTLALFGFEVGVSVKSIEMLRQQLDELNKRNRILRLIHNQLRKSPIITGRIPRNVNADDIKKMLLRISDEIKSLNMTNLEIKKQIAALKAPQKQIEPDIHTHKMRRH